jgi:rhamnulokinase
MRGVTPAHDRYVACDLGGESGRVMLGTLEGGRLRLDEAHRFPTAGIAIAGTLRWDMLGMWNEVKTGLRKIAARGVAVDSISTDAWGVDYVLVRRGEPQLTPPFHHRDPRTEGGYERVAAKIPLDDVFAETGIQFMPINTLYQLEDDIAHRPQVLALAETFLGVGDYINWLLCGAAKMEESMASTTQMWNPRARRWSDAIVSGLGLPRHLLPEVVPSGAVLGELLPEVAAEVGIAEAAVVATCAHDTGAAVAAVPADGEGWAFISSGTWSLLGVETREPIITPASRRANFTNEVGFGGSIRFLKNIVGLWIVQECRRAWLVEGADLGYESLTDLARVAKPFAALINPDDPRFARPRGMPRRIAAYCHETGQAVPASYGQVVRCALESLALSYRRVLDELETVTGRRISRLHIVGGGSRNQLLNQFAADATGREVVAGPVEATAIGNLLMQGLALGRLEDLADLRRVVRASFPVQTYHAKDRDLWDAAYRRFRALP